MNTKVEIVRGSVGSKKGWCFEVYYKGREYANVVSALYRTKKEAFKASQDYLETGHLDFYGSAE